VIACNHLPVIDGKGAWRDNRMIERLWRSLKYECVYLNAFETGSEMRAGIGKWLTYYNSERPHSTHGILTPEVNRPLFAGG
jgi:putative transposase